MTNIIYCHPGSELYGSDRMALETVLALVGDGYNVITILPDEGPLTGLMRQHGLSVRTMPVPVLRKKYMSPVGMIKLLAQSLGSVRRVWRMVSNPKTDGVYVNTVTQPLWSLLTWLARKPLIVHVREAESDASRLVRAVVTAPVAVSTVTLANSIATADFVRASSFTGPRELRVVYNGKDWGPYFRRDPEPIGSTIKLVVVGRLSPRKGQDLVLEAISILSERGVSTEVKFVGDVFPGYEWYRRDLEDRARALGARATVSFEGFTSDISEFLDWANIGVVPSRLEPFGTVAAEIMAAKRLVIAASTEGLLEIVQNDQTGLIFESDNAADLAKVILNVARDPSKYRSLSERGFDSVLSRFGLSTYRQDIRGVVAGAFSPGAKS